MRNATIHKMDRMANQHRFTRWGSALLAAVFVTMLAVPQPVFSQLVGMKLFEKGTPSPVGQSLTELKKAYDEFQQTGSSELYGFCEQVLLLREDRVVIDAVASGDPNTLLADLQALGLQNGSTYGRIVSGQLPIDSIPDLTALNGMKSISAGMAQTRVGLTTSQGDPAMRADLARATFGVDGTGVTVGTLSDSYDCLVGAAADVGSGDLPAGVTVLKDETGCFSGSDEGRAMMQLSHDVAPGAALSFHTAFDGLADFALGIQELAGCPPGSDPACGLTPGGAAAVPADIIVDDVIYFAEPMFQDGIIAQAVDIVKSSGVCYFSSAGNNARDAYESPFRSSGIPGLFGGDRHDFDPGAGVDDLLDFTLGTGLTIFVFQWDEPFFSVSGAPGSASDVDILLYFASGAFTGLGGIASNIGGDPVEIFGVINSGPPTVLKIGLELFAGPLPGAMKVVMFTGSSTAFVPDTYAGVNAGTIYGHANAAGAEAVGASFYGDTPEFGTSPPLLEPFSSAGSTPILFDIFGTRLGSPVVRAKPEIVAPDGTDNTFFGFDFEPNGFPNFFGTSAAAPHAAAVAALMKQLAPSLTPDQAYDILETTAIDMDDPGFDFDSGFGLIQADAALAKASLPHDLLFLAEEFVQSKQHKRFEGNIFSNNDIILKKGKKSKIVGDLRAVDDIEIAKKNDIDGDVTAGDEVENDGDVSGTITEDGGVAPVPLPAIASFATGTEDIEVDKKETLELAPGTYDNVEVKKKGTLILKHDGTTGEYFLETLELAKKAELVIDVRTGPVTVNVARRLTFGQRVEVEIVATGGNDTELVTFNMPDDDDDQGDDFVEIGKKAVVLGTIIAPDAWVILKKSSRFKGAICAENIVVEKGVVALHHGSSSSLPKVAPDAEDVADDEQILVTSLPTEFELQQNHPNPFNPSTTISFALPKAGELSLKIYNLRGQLVATLHAGALAAGRHQMVWDGKDARGANVASGIYVYRLETDGFVASKKLTLMK